MISKTQLKLLKKLKYCNSLIKICPIILMKSLKVCNT